MVYESYMKALNSFIKEIKQKKHPKELSIVLTLSRHVFA